MKVLVTGATGFLGVHVCRALMAAGHDVRALVRPTSGTSLSGLACAKVTGDVTIPETLDAAVDGVDSVIHAAADISDWDRDTERLTRVNVDGARHIAAACLRRRVQRLVHVSSVAAVGIPDHAAQIAAEDFPFNLESSGLAYHLSKRRGEAEIIAAVERGLEAIIVNPSSIKGPHGRSYRGGEIADAVRRAPVVPYFTGGISVAHVADVADGVVAALDKGTSGERYILGGDNLSFRALAERMAAALGLRRLFVPFSPAVMAAVRIAGEPYARLRGRRPYMTRAVEYCATRYQYYDSSKARAALGYAPRTFDAIAAECLGFAPD